MPVVADIHFDYRAALACAEAGVDKIRINPGNIGSDAHVREVADACRLNRSYFSKLFKENMGCPPQEFLIGVRLAKAAELMCSSDVPISEIAVRCGYSNQFHFSRAFKKHYKTPPQKWRAQNRRHSLPEGKNEG